MRGDGARGFLQRRCAVWRDLALALYFKRGWLAAPSTALHTSQGGHYKIVTRPSDHFVGTSGGDVTVALPASILHLHDVGLSSLPLPGPGPDRAVNDDNGYVGRRSQESLLAGGNASEDARQHAAMLFAQL